MVPMVAARAGTGMEFAVLFDHAVLRRDEFRGGENTADRPRATITGVSAPWWYEVLPLLSVGVEHPGQWIDSEP